MIAMLVAVRAVPTKRAAVVGYPRATIVRYPPSQGTTTPTIAIAPYRRFAISRMHLNSNPIVKRRKIALKWAMDATNSV